jgi:hypothetical protein
MAVRPTGWYRPHHIHAPCVPSCGVGRWGTVVAGHHRPTPRHALTGIASVPASADGCHSPSHNPP